MMPRSNFAPRLSLGQRKHIKKGLICPERSITSAQQSVMRLGPPSIPRLLSVLDEDFDVIVARTRSSVAADTARGHAR